LLAFLDERKKARKSTAAKEMKEDKTKKGKTPGKDPPSKEVSCQKSVQASNSVVLHLLCWHSFARNISAPLLELHGDLSDSQLFSGESPTNRVYIFRTTYVAVFIKILLL